jgi:tRNA modification GTPase
MNASAHTIAALSTPTGRGALAVIRLTGDEAQDVFAKIISEAEKFKNAPARQIGIYTVINDTYCNDGSLPPAIDEVTAIKYNTPRSYTGENMVEIFCHGGAIIPAKILEQLFNRGARAAGRGEFSRRAFVNGKLSVLKAESIRELIESQTETRLRSAQLAYHGKQLESLERLKTRLISALSDIESRIEFGEDDDVAESRLDMINENRRKLEVILAELEDELRRGDRVKAFDDGIIAALAGPANAGKSSLFNEILGFERSIVHNVPGTTRDIVSERIIFEGTSVKLFDSAGIRDTNDAVERRGIERTLSAIKDAHAVIWVTSAAEPLEEVERVEILDIVKDSTNNNERQADLRQNRQITAPTTKCHFVGKILVVINKTDIPAPHTISAEKRQFCEEHSLKYVETSLIEGTNRNALFDVIGATIRGVLEEVPIPEIIVNERHRGIVVTVIQDLRECIANFDREEVAAHFLRSALDRLTEFSGYVASDEILDEIFGKFCIGK